MRVTSVPFFLCKSNSLLGIDVKVAVGALIQLRKQRRFARDLSLMAMSEAQEKAIRLDDSQMKDLYQEAAWSATCGWSRVHVRGKAV